MCVVVVDVDEGEHLVEGRPDARNSGVSVQYREDRGRAVVELRQSQVGSEHCGLAIDRLFLMSRRWRWV